MSGRQGRRERETETEGQIGRERITETPVRGRDKESSDPERDTGRWSVRRLGSPEGKGETDSSFLS